MRNSIFISVLVAFSNALFAQLDNRVFWNQAPDTLQTGQAGFFVDHLNFSKNNEYFNKITDGYTLFGFQLIPTVKYRFHPAFTLEAGAFLRKDYGNSGIREFEPVLTACITSGRHRILMGTLEGGLQHNLIEPLFEFENQLVSRLENGAQWKYNGGSFTADAWIDWRTMIYNFSPNQEEVFAGLVCSKSLTNKGRFLVSFDFQGTAYHKGGQIDTVPDPLITWFHGAPGIKISHQHAETGFFRGLGFQFFVPTFLDYSFTNKLPFNRNFSPYLNLSAELSHGTLMLSFWQSDGFQHNRGGRLYRTVSSGIFNPGYSEKRRRLIIIRWMSDFRIAPNISFSTRIEPYYDLENKLWEFSNGMYLNFRSRIRKPKTELIHAGN